MTNETCIITISGVPGSGKSTVATMLAEHLGCERVYMGGIFRQMAAARDISLRQFYEGLENNPDLEKEADAMLVAAMQSARRLIAEGRVAFLWDAPERRKVDTFITVDEQEAARRILQSRQRNERPEEEQAATIDDIVHQTRKRVAAERRRYQALYDVDDHHDPNHFDVIVDTTNKTPEEVVAAVLDAVA